MADKKAKAEEPQQTPKADETKDGMESLAGKTIDQRMADLLRDHKKMGAR